MLYDGQQWVDGVCLGLSHFHDQRHISFVTRGASLAWIMTFWHVLGLGNYMDQRFFGFLWVLGISTTISIYTFVEFFWVVAALCFLYLCHAAHASHSDHAFCVLE